MSVRNQQQVCVGALYALHMLYTDLLALAVFGIYQ
jgi:hypothetical protein